MTTPTIRPCDQYGNAATDYTGWPKKSDPLDELEVPSENLLTTQFRSTADSPRLQAIFDKAAKAGEIYHRKYGNPWKLSRGQLADMNGMIANAKAESRTLNPLFKQIGPD